MLPTHDTIRLVQLQHRRSGRRVARVEGNQLRRLETADSIYRLAEPARSGQRRLAEVVSAALSADVLDYVPVYHGQSDWRLLPAFDHPDEPARCLVAGTGLPCNRRAGHRVDDSPDAAWSAKRPSELRRGLQWQLPRTLAGYCANRCAAIPGRCMRCSWQQLGHCVAVSRRMRGLFIGYCAEAASDAVRDAARLLRGLPPYSLIRGWCLTKLNGFQFQKAA